MSVYKFIETNSDEAKRVLLQMEIGEVARKAGAREPARMAAEIMKNSRNVQEGTKAVEHLKATRPDRFHGDSHAPKTVDPAKLTMPEYLKIRNENPAALGLRPRGSRR